MMARSSPWMLTLAVALTAGLAQLAAAAGPASPTPPPSTLWSIIATTKDLSTLRDLLDFASGGKGAAFNFKAALSNVTGPPLTVFAPNNAAFDDLVARLGPLASGKFIGNRTAVSQVLLTHVVAGSALSSTQLSAGVKLKSLQGAALEASKASSSSSSVVVAAPGSTGTVLGADIKAGAQEMLVVDAVLLPTAGMVPSRPPPMVRTLYQMVSADPGLSTLHALIDLASASGPVNFRQVLSNTSESLTLFAPSNQAFNALMETLGTNASQALLSNTTAITEVLLTHVVGQVVLSRDLVNRATFASLEGVNLTARRNRFFTQIDSPGNAGFVDTFDLRGGTPVMHVIDGVLVPVMSFLPPSLYDILTDKPEFQTLKAMVDFASTYGDVDFASALANRSAAITVLAPINSAFDQFFDDLGPSGTSLFSNVTVITGLLLGHVLGRAVNTSGLTNGSVWTTTLGTNLTVLVAPAADGSGNVTRVASGGAVAEIIVPNVYGGQAVAHAIDEVLLPDPLSPPGNNSLYDVIAASEELGVLKALIDFASAAAGGVNFTALLSDRAANLTVFCPVDAAFETLEVKLGGAAWSALKSNATAVTAVLLTHVLGYVVNGSKLDNGLALVTQQPGVNLTVKGTTSYTDIVSPGSTGRVAAFNLRGGASVAHIINGVLLPAPVPKPPTPPGQTLYQLLGTDPTFATLKLMVDVASTGPVNFTAVLSNSSQPLTLFAPSSDAFEDYFAEQGISAAALSQNVSAVTSILQLHVVLGKAYFQVDLTDGLVLPSLLPSVNLTVSLRPPSVLIATPGSTGTIVQLDLARGKAVAQGLDVVLLVTPLLSQVAEAEQRQAL